MASTAARAARAAQAVEELQAQATALCERLGLEVQPPAQVRDAEATRTGWIEYAGRVMAATCAALPARKAAK